MPASELATFIHINDHLFTNHFNAVVHPERKLDTNLPSTSISRGFSFIYFRQTNAFNKILVISERPAGVY